MPMRLCCRRCLSPPTEHALPLKRYWPHAAAASSILSSPALTWIMEGGGEEKSSTTVYPVPGANDLVIREQRSKGLSFQVWPAASALCIYLQDKYSSSLADLSILELGSGPGLVGLTAARLGAKKVLLTDLPQAIPNLWFNAQANFPVVNEQVQVRALSWGVEEDVVNLGGATFDLILASDVIYYDYLFQPLLQTLKWLTLGNNNNNNIIVLLSHIRRWTKDSKFFKMARKLFQVQAVETYPPPAGAKKQVVIYCLTPKQQNGS